MGSITSSLASLLNTILTALQAIGSGIAGVYIAINAIKILTQPDNQDLTHSCTQIIIKAVIAAILLNGAAEIAKIIFNLKI